ncbi:hypothetical protein EXW31_27775 (plasmid) [Bacillus mycoides]|uniref:hypothetical protein n=1 Tax=Bacillus mycoides TaxID=1405 RepID=UPI00081615F7|nr:hypothetical protein [Bacillus mycoides]QWG36586.1 hypothetical protein EXW30_27575 [Bacillus mycoides]QWG47997.1 hypothetical protein EXW31_27775 [Bacillus mycoides]QWH15133.1 hypothetical protein EXW38_28105 [Bacillus mycoides]SCB94453.1 Uncharacterized protein BW664_00844 [Bacillus mycoides]
MKKFLNSKLFVVGALSAGLSISAVTPSFAAENGVLPDTSVISSDEYVTPVQGTTQNGKNGTNTLASSYVSTHSWVKNYKNLYGINVAKNEAYAQWTWGSGRISNFGGLWQSNWTAPLYGYDNESNSWNYKYNSSGQTNQSTKFSSGIPTPWGHAGGSQFTSRILINVTGYGNSSAQ